MDARDEFVLMCRVVEELGWDRSQLVVARTFIDRLLGMVAYRRSGVVLGFPRCSSVHTCFMRAPIDLVFVGACGEILRVERHVPPWRISSCRGARMVLERFSGVPASVRATGRFACAPWPNRSGPVRQEDRIL